jgi:hypothetical protein
MSGNESEMPDGDDSTRLADRARDLGQRAAEGSTRLADRAMTAFERRRRRAQRAREAVDERTSEFADALGLDPGQIEPVQLDDRGEEIGFVPSESGREALVSDFASERPFVEPSEALVEADPREGTQTRVRPAATDDIAERARREFAGEDPFAKPRDFAVDVGAGGVREAEFTDAGQRRRASRQFEGETALEEADPSAEIEQTDEGFRLAGQADDRLAARRFESETETFGSGELDPEADIRETDSGFQLADEPVRELAADRLDEQVTQTDVSPDDVRERDSGFQLDARARRRVAARQFESELETFGTGDLQPTSDIREAGDGFGLAEGARRELAADRLDEQLPGTDVGREDVRQTGDGFALAEDPAREVAARRLDQQVDAVDVSPSDIELEETGDGFEAIFEGEVPR